jgi:hypothetical protein
MRELGWCKSVSASKWVQAALHRGIKILRHFQSPGAHRQREESSDHRGALDEQQNPGELCAHTDRQTLQDPAMVSC